MILNQSVKYMKYLDVSNLFQDILILSTSSENE